MKVQGRFQHPLRAGASGVAQLVGTHARSEVKLDLISVRAVLRADGADIGSSPGHLRDISLVPKGRFRLFYFTIKG
eukprot:359565-Prymnesium_polylepis.1